MQHRIHLTSPLSSRYTLWPAACLAAASLVLLVWANTCNRRTTPEAAAASTTERHDSGQRRHDPHAQPGTPAQPDEHAAEPGHASSDEPTEVLIDRLLSDDADTRSAAADALAHRSPYAVIPHLQPKIDRQLADDTLGDDALAQVLRVYRQWGAAEPALLDRALASESTRVDGVCAMGEWWSRVPGRYAKLTIAADDPSPQVRRAVLRVCLIADTAQGAGIAQLTRGHPMDAELSAAYDATMQQLAHHGLPILAASRRQRVAAMSYAELLDEPRDEHVLTALLLHPELPAEAFEPTLVEAAEMAGNAPIDRLIQLLSSATPPQMQSKPTLGLALAHWPTEKLAPRVELLQRMARDERSPDSLHAAAAATRVMLLDDNSETLTSTREAIGDPVLLACITLIPEPDIRDRLGSIVMPLVMAPSPAATVPDALFKRALAIRALPHIPSVKDELYAILVRIAREDPDTAVRFVALELLADIPRAHWPAGHDDLVLTRITLRTVPNQMAYEPKQFTVTAGRPVVIELINPDTMEHNLVIAAPGRLNDVGLDAALLGDTGGPNRDFVPDSPHVLHYTHMVQPGETAALQFIAPIAPGDYPFVCTYPSHWTSMNGIMHVAAP